MQYILKYYDILKTTNANVNIRQCYSNIIMNP